MEYVVPVEYRCACEPCDREFNTEVVFHNLGRLYCCAEHGDMLKDEINTVKHVVAIRTRLRMEGLSSDRLKTT